VVGDLLKGDLVVADGALKGFAKDGVEGLFHLGF